MNKRREFDDILDECLERLLVKGETMEQCLESYPEQAAELRLLLSTAADTKEALAIEPRPEFKARARYQLLSALNELKPKRWLPFFLSWKPQWATALALFLALLLAGGGTVVAAGSSMPDTLLYPVKLATEQVQLVLTPSSLGKAGLYARLADKRVAEIAYLVDSGQPEEIEPTAQRLENLLGLMAALPLAENGESKVMLVPGPTPVPPPPAAESGKDVRAPSNQRAKLKLLLERYAVDQPAVLRAALDRVPEAVKPTLRRLITESESSYEKTIASLD